MTAAVSRRNAYRMLWEADLDDVATRLAMSDALDDADCDPLSVALLRALDLPVQAVRTHTEVRACPRIELEVTFRGDAGVVQYEARWGEHPAGHPVWWAEQEHAETYQPLRQFVPAIWHDADELAKRIQAAVARAVRVKAMEL